MDWVEFRRFYKEPRFRHFLKVIRGVNSDKPIRDQEVRRVLKNVGLLGDFKDVCHILSQGVNHTPGKLLTRYGRVARKKGKLLPLKAVLEAQKAGKPLYEVPFVDIA